MKDRIVEHPNRYKLVPVMGEAGVYDLEAMPGVVTEVGTPVNKRTLLTDETAALFSNVDTVDAALSLMAPAGKNYRAVLLRSINANGIVFPNLQLKITAPANYVAAFGSPNFTTNEKGEVYLSLPIGATFTVTRTDTIIGLSPAATAVSFAVTAGKTLQTVSLAPMLTEVASGQITYTTSQNVIIAAHIKNIDAFLVSGGNHGASGSNNTVNGYIADGGNGGNGGKSLTVFQRPVNVTVALVSVGGPSGNSSFLGLNSNDGEQGGLGGLGGKVINQQSQIGDNGSCTTQRSPLYSGLFSGGGAGGGSGVPGGPPRVGGYSTCGGGPGGPGGSGGRGDSDSYKNGYAGSTGGGPGNGGGGGGGASSIRYSMGGAGAPGGSGIVVIRWGVA